MVDESLVAAFRQKLSNTGITENVELRLRNLISYNETENPFTEMETNVIIQALENLKVLDPACGSGAFPMGILHKLVWILRKVDPENKIWFESIIKRLPTYAQPEMRKKLEGENWDYLRKLGVVQQSVYGVDIQPIAIQIAKLRFFISLLLDQDIKGNEENNYGVLPLPNLDFKLVSANTLIGTPDQNHQNYGRLFFVQDEFFDTFNKLTGQYFGTYEPAEKKKLTKKIEKLVSGKVQEKVDEIQRLSTHADERFSKHVAEKNKVLIEQKKNDAKLWNSYNNLFKHESVGFFEIKYFFPEAKEGFDVVIGNSPYVQIQSFSGMPQQKDWEKQKYETYTKTGDVYCLFYERGYRLLNDGGVLTFITSNKWMRANYGRVMRKFFTGNGAISQLIDFGDSPIFENATTYTNILVWKKDKQEVKTRAWDLSKVYASDVSLDNLLVQQGECVPLFNENSFVVVKGEQTAIKQRIEEIGVPLKDWDISIYRGILTGLNEAFIIDGKKKDELIAKDPKSAEIIKPILRGRDIKRYKSEFADLWLINTHNGYTDKNGRHIPRIDVKKDYPAIWEYFNLKNKDFDGKVEKRVDQGVHWINLRNCAYLQDFTKPKVIFGRFMDKPTYTFDKDGFLVNDALYFAAPATQYLAAILNSKVNWFYLSLLCTDLANGFLQALLQYQVQIPVPRIPANKQLLFETLVDCILFCKERNLEQESWLFESVIDGMVYELYFPGEIKAAGCEVLKHIAKLPEFKDDWSDEKKLAVIEKVYKELSDPKHPVSVAMVKIQEIPEVKLIEGKE